MIREACERQTNHLSHEKNVGGRGCGTLGSDWFLTSAQSLIGLVSRSSSPEITEIADYYF